MKILKSTSGVAFATLSSRILGMLRDILFAAFIGGETIMSAWILAFTMPNLFRRLLGEGALGTALVPLLTRSLDQKNGRDKAAGNFVLLLGILGIFLALISLLVAIICLIVFPFIQTERVKLTFQILPVIMPYVIFICLSGVAGAALNSIKKFFIPALTSLILNIALILCLLLIVPILIKPFSILFALSIAVLLAGILQLLIMLAMLKHEGMLGNLQLAKLKSAKNDPFIRETWKLTLPGLVGASALQVSLLVDRWLACLLGNYAIPALYYSDRIVFLTIGVFAVAMGSVILPDMSRFAAKEDYKGMSNTLIVGLRHMLFICIPAAFFTFFFRVGLIKCLFMRGAFDDKALQETAWALSFYALGIPFFATIKILVSGFYSRKDMKTPVKISIICILLNIILNLILMWPLRQGGIALATVISSVIQNTVLLFLLHRQIKFINIKEILFAALKILSAAAVAILSSATAYNNFTGSMNIFVAIIIAAIIFAATYMMASIAFNSKEINEWLSIIGFSEKRL